MGKRTAIGIVTVVWLSILGAVGVFVLVSRTEQNQGQSRNADGQRVLFPERGAEFAYEWETAAVVATIVTVLALAVGGWLWIKVHEAGGERVGPPTAEGWTGSTLQSGPLVATSLQAERASAAYLDDVAESLRQLKALREEGILTDDEYEAKRKALADQL